MLRRDKNYDYDTNLWIQLTLRGDALIDICKFGFFEKIICYKRLKKFKNTEILIFLLKNNYFFLFEGVLGFWGFGTIYH